MAARTLAFLAVLAVLPAACADLRVGPIAASAAPIAPETGATGIVVPFTIACQDLPPAAVFGAVTVSAEVEAPAGVIVTGPLQLAVPTEPCATSPTGELAGTMDFTAKVGSQARGEVPLPITFTLSRPENDVPTAGSPSGQGSTTITAAYHGLLSVNVPTTILQAGGGKAIEFGIDVTSLANAPTRVTFSLEPGFAEGWLPMVPPPVVLDAPGDPGAQATARASFVVVTPAGEPGNQSEQMFTIVATPSSERDPRLTGSPVAIHLLARMREAHPGNLTPEPKEAAAVGAVLPLLLLGLAAIGSRAREPLGARLVARPRTDFPAAGRRRDPR